MLRAAITFILALWAYTGANAQSVAPIDTLFRALGLPEVIEIMQQEGMRYGQSLEDELFVGQGGAVWASTVADIYAPDRLNTIVRDRLDQELAAVDLAPMIAFFSTELGRRIIGLEVSARRALLDKGIEDASTEAFQNMLAENDPRVELIYDFAEAGDLIDNNVVGALNSNFAFYKGLGAAGGFGEALSEEIILSDVWQQEPDIRADTTEWVFSYLALAYRPLSDAELRAYVDFSQSVAGKRLNSAIFAAFDEMFVGISAALGQAAAGYMAGEEL